MKEMTESEMMGQHQRERLNGRFSVSLHIIFFTSFFAVGPRTEEGESEDRWEVCFLFLHCLLRNESTEIQNQKPMGKKKKGDPSISTLQYKFLIVHGNNECSALDGLPSSPVRVE